MKEVFFVPDRGDVILLSIPAGVGRRRTAGPRLAVVLSPQAYNARVGMALLCPVATEIKGYPFEVRLPEGLPVQGVVLADQAASLDWRALRAERICALPQGAIEEILGKLKALLA
jgi:mRNA interferase MazF